VSRLVHDRVMVRTTGGVEVHRRSGCTTRPDGTLRIHDSAGIDRRIYADGYWLQVTLEGDKARAS
jgi:hypothetical protein